MSQTRIPVRKTRHRFYGVGLSLVFGAATCLVGGSLTSATVAAIIAGVLLALGVSAFALHRASLRLDDLIAP